MKRFLVISFITSVFAFQIASPNAIAKDPIKVGVLVPLSGIAAAGGKEMSDGIMMAAKEKKTVMGRPIELIVEDTRMKPDVGVSKAEKLVYKDGCVALIGGLSSGVGLALAKNIDRIKVPFLTTNIMTTKFYGLHKYIFRSGQIANDQVAVGNIQGILSNPDLKKRTYYVLVHDYSWGHDAGEKFIELAKKNGIKIYNEKYDKAPTKTKDWSSYISKIKASGADGVYACLIMMVVPSFVKQAHDFGLTEKCKIVNGAAPGPRELEQCGDKCHGIYATLSWSWDIDTPESNAWEKRYFQMFHNLPTTPICRSYVGAMNLFNAIERIQSTDPDRIALSLKGISHNGPYGTVRISPVDNCMRNDIIFIETQPAQSNIFGAKTVLKVVHKISAEQVGPPEPVEK